MRFAILTPTRSRPEGLYKLFKSINSTISGVHDIDLVIGVDNDDPKKPKYLDLHKKLNKEANKRLRVIMVYDKRKPLARIWNSLVKYSDADWFTCGNDDEIYITKSWDDIFFSKINTTHPYHLYWFDDGLQHGNHCAFPVLSKQWIKEVGYFFPECFHHNYVDTWVYDIACKLQVTTYIPEVQHQHLHHSIGLSKMDETYTEGMTENERDKEIFLQTEAQRNEVVERLKIKIWGQEH